jgi:TonB family protein
VWWAMRPERPEYVFAAPTVVTVTDKGGPAVLYAPDTIYPAQALRDRVEGTVKLHVKIDSEGRVVKAEALSGPGALVQAAIDSAMQSQYVAEATETDLLFPFSLAHPGPRTFAAPELLQRVAPVYGGKVRGMVRVAAMVNPEGGVDFVQPVSGPKALVAAAVQSVQQWRFRPTLRDGIASYGTTVLDVPFH